MRAGSPRSRSATSGDLLHSLRQFPHPRRRDSSDHWSFMALQNNSRPGTSSTTAWAEINDLRRQVDHWRKLPSSEWRVTPETARLLRHWRHHQFSGIRPFFCQVEAVETVVWLTEVAPSKGKAGRRFLEHLEKANDAANPGLPRLALKLATGTGKTAVMAMLIAWQGHQCSPAAQQQTLQQRFPRGYTRVDNSRAASSTTAERP